MQKENESLGFVKGLNLEFIVSLKTNGPRYWSIFDDSCEENCHSKAFVDVTTAGIHRGLSTTYIRNNSFHQSKLGFDLELQNPHIVAFKSPRDQMQFNTLSEQLGLRSKLIDWYRDVMSVLHGHLLIDLSHRKQDRVRFGTNTGSIPTKFHIPDRLKQSKILNHEHTKSSYSPIIPFIFPQMQKSFPLVLPKRANPVFFANAK